MLVNSDIHVLGLLSRMVGGSTGLVFQSSWLFHWQDDRHSSANIWTGSCKSWPFWARMPHHTHIPQHG